MNDIMKLENWLSTLETNKSNEEMLNKTERNLNLQTINTNSLVYSGNNSQLYTITFQDNRKEKFPSLRQKSSIRNKKAKTLSSTSRSNSCVFVIDIKNMIKEIVADSRTERYSDEIKPNKKSNNSIINDLKPQSGSYAEQIKKVKTQNELREVRHNSRPIRQTNPQSKKVIRNNDSLELRNLIPNYKVNSNHVHKSDMRYSYLWDLIDIKERRNPIKDEENKVFDFTQKKIKVEHSPSKNQTVNKGKAKTEEISYRFRDGKYLSNYFINRKNALLEQILGEAYTTGTLGNEKVYRKNVEWLNLVNESKAKREKIIHEESKITNETAKVLHSFKRSISKHKKEFIDNCEECDDPYEEDSLSHKKETYTPSLFNATNRNLNVSSKLKISPYVSNLKQTQKSNSITKDIVKEDDDTQSEEIKPVPVLLREEKKDQSLIDEEIPTESNPHKNEEKIKDKNEGNPIRQGHRTFSQRIKEVENIISEKKAKYEKQKEEYSIKVKQLLERHNMNPCDG